MNFEYNEEQQLLTDSVKRFLSKEYRFESREKIIASAAGYSEHIWSAFADMGLLGLPFTADYGGFGGAAVDMMGVMEAMGEALVVEPYLSTVGLGAQFITRAGTEAQKSVILPSVASGKLQLVFAQTEKDARYNLPHVATKAKKSSSGWVLDGEKCAVIHAPCADQFVISARTSGGDADVRGISLFLVGAKATGITLNSYLTIDELRAADISFEGVSVGKDALIGTEGHGLELIEEVVDYATALLCAEAVGALKYANDATLEYIKTRKQFGVLVGTFQALQHRMVDMMISYEQARSMACLACVTIDFERDPAERRRIISAAKIQIADACRHVSQEAVQLQGAMGMSDEMKVSHTFRRLTVIAQQFGDADYHVERFAA